METTTRERATRASSHDVGHPATGRDVLQYIQARDGFERMVFGWDALAVEEHISGGLDVCRHDSRAGQEERKLALHAADVEGSRPSCEPGREHVPLPGVKREP